MLLASALLFSITGTSCSNDDNTTPEKEKTYDMSGFAKGADVSWLTEMEGDGVNFYSASGKKQECLSLLRDLGVNSIRLRVWVQERCRGQGLASTAVGLPPHDRLPLL